MFNLTEKNQAIHRTFNTVLGVVTIVIGLLLINPIIDSTSEIYNKVSGIEAERIVNSEIAQIGSDEGYRPCYYKDSLGLGTIGFGTLVNDTMKRGDCIDAHEAVGLLRYHYTVSDIAVSERYPWAKGETKLVLINLTYNMGETRLAKFEKMLTHLAAGKHDLAAGELLNSVYAIQVPTRAGRMASRIMAIRG